MKVPKFERNKIQRVIRTNGMEYTFYRDGTDDFGEPTDEVEKTIVKGIFHQTTQHIEITAGNSASVQRKQVPYILAMYSVAKGIKQGDYTVIDGIRYNVTGLIDYQHWNIAMDISLEAVV